MPAVREATPGCEEALALVRVGCMLLKTPFTAEIWRSALL